MVFLLLHGGGIPAEVMVNHRCSDVEGPYVPVLVFGSYFRARAVHLSPETFKRARKWSTSRGRGLRRGLK